MTSFCRNRLINIDHQLSKISGIGYHVDPPKTKSGIRQIRMSAAVYEALGRVLKNRGRAKPIVIDSYGKFLFLNRNGLPKVAVNYDSMFRGLVKKYNKNHEETLPKVTTPHTLRHPYVKHKTKSFLRNSRVFKADFCAPSHSLCTEVFHFPDNINLISGVNIHTFNQCVSQGGI